MKEHFCPAEKTTITYQGKCNWCGESEGSMTQEALKQWADDISKAYDILAWGHSERAAEILKNTKVSIYKALAQTQEPVAHWSDCSVHSEPAYPKGECDCGGFPPQRTWVDLTAEQMLECNMDGKWTVDRETAKLNVQAKLKELNT